MFLRGWRILATLVCFSTVAFTQQTIEPSTSATAAEAGAGARVAARMSATPPLVKFSGVVLGQRGIVGMTFAVYREQTGGAPLWLETQNVTLQDDGHYTVLLGASHADGLPIALFASGEARWLAVQVDGQAELPRTLLVSVPYALNAANAETLGGKPLSAFMLAGDSTGTGNDGLNYINTAAVQTASATLFAGTPGAIAKFGADGSSMVGSVMMENNGKIGVGTSTPAFTLDIQNTDTTAAGAQLLNVQTNSTYGARIFFSSTAANGRAYGIGSNFISGQGEFGVYDYTANVPRLVINRDGFMGVGVASPGFLLDLATTDTTAAGSQLLQLTTPSVNGAKILFNSTAANGRTYGFGSNFILGQGEFGIYDYAASATRLMVAASGNVGIGTSTPSSKLEVNGDVKISNGSGGGLMFADGTRQTTATSGTITSVAAGSGLSGGGNSGNVSLSANFNSVQARVAGVCAAGNAITSINADGTVNCQPVSGGSGGITLPVSWTGAAAAPAGVVNVTDTANGPAAPNNGPPDPSTIPAAIVGLASGSGITAGVVGKATGPDGVGVMGISSASESPALVAWSQATGLTNEAIGLDAILQNAVGKVIQAEAMATTVPPCAPESQNCHPLVVMQAKAAATSGPVTGFEADLNSTGATGLNLQFSATPAMMISANTPNASFQVDGNANLNSSGTLQANGLHLTGNGITFADGTSLASANGGGSNLSLSSPDGSISVGGSGSNRTVALNSAFTDGRYAPATGSPNYAPATGSLNYAPATGSPSYAPATGSPNYAPATGSSSYAPATGSPNYAPATGSANYAPATGSPNYAPVSGSPNYAPATGSLSYAPAIGSLNYLAKAGDTMTGALTLPANGLQMAGNQIVTTGGQFGYGASPNAAALFDVGGTFMAPTYTAHLLQVDGTVKSNSSYAQAYLRGINVAPTFDLTGGYANYLVGIETYMGTKIGSAVAHSVVGYHLGAQPTSGLECSVGFGISVPNQQPSLCNGKYGFYQGDPAAQYNYFASSVGIGTPFPSQALTVQGNVQIGGAGNKLMFPDGTFISSATGLGNTYTAGTGLSLAGSQFSVNYAGNGSATTAARSDHNHDANYLGLGGGTLTGSLNVTNGKVGIGATPQAYTLVDINGSITVPAPTSWGAHLLTLDGTTKASSAGQAYLKGLYVAPTFDVTAGYANYITGAEVYIAPKVGSNVAHSIVGYHLNGQPTGGVECNVGFGISVPNQNTALCNGTYGFYQGGGAQYNYFANSVGIGTPFPAQALHVKGNVQVDGNLIVAGSATQALNLTSGGGQPVSLTAGAGSGSGAAATIAAGNAGTASGGTGGSLNLTAGNAMAQGGAGYTNAGPGGGVNITAGSGYNTVGGNVVITSGSTSTWATGSTFSKVSLQGGIANTGDGANIDVEGGHTTGSPGGPAPSIGGNVVIRAGTASGTQAGGNIVLQAGAGSPGGTVQVTNSRLGIGAAPAASNLVDVNGTITESSWWANVLHVGGTAQSSNLGQAYLAGLNVNPTYNLASGYANYLAGVWTSVDPGQITGGNVVHSVVGYFLSNQPTSGLECNVGFGIAVPNQNPAACNGTYGLYQGGTAQYNFLSSKLGIGTPFPAEMLEVSGNAKIDGNLQITGGGNGLKFPDGTVQTTAGGGGGGVSITSPSSTINVGGTASAPTVDINTTYADGRYAPLSGSANYVQINPSGAQTGALNLTGSATIGGALTVGGSSALSAGLLQSAIPFALQTSTASQGISIQAGPLGGATGVVGGHITLTGGSGAWPSGGNLGGGKIDITGGYGPSTADCPFGGCSGRVLISGGSPTGTYAGGGSIVLSATPGTGGYPNGNIVLQGGNVGIGTASPGQPLDVAGNINASGNLTASGNGAMPVYNNSGTAQPAAHMVTGNLNFAGGSVGVTLGGSAIFSSASSYVCTVTGSTVQPFAVMNNAGSSFTITGGADPRVSYICVGN